MAELQGGGKQKRSATSEKPGQGSNGSSTADGEKQGTGRRKEGASAEEMRAKERSGGGAY